MTIYNHQTDADDIMLMKYAMYLARVEDPMTVAHTLKHGLEALDQRGWTQGKIMAPDNRVCLLGALMAGNNLAISQGQTMTGFNVAEHHDIGPALTALAVMSGYDPTWLAPVRDIYAGMDDRRVTVVHHVTSWNDKREQYEPTTFGAHQFMSRVSSRTVDEVRDLIVKTIAVLEVL